MDKNSSLLTWLDGAVARWAAKRRRVAGLVRTRGISRLACAALCAGTASLAFLSYAAEPLPSEPSGSTARAGPRGDWPEPISPLLPVVGLRAELVELGGKLFSDKRLSGDAKRSCASCHKLDAGGGDGRRRGIGASGQELLFNVPSIFNAWKNYRYNWRGNFSDLAEQNETILLDPRIMSSAWDDIIRVLGDDPDYVLRFEAVFGKAPDRDGVLEALGAFQRSLTTVNGRFDRYLTGDPGAITAEEERGYVLFKSFGCISCHQGENVGGNLMQRFPLFQPGLAPAASGATETAKTANLGRFAVTGNPDDLYLFRVPSLRNVALTAPYFHDGRAASLHDAVAEMAASQLGRMIPQSDVDLIVKFLATLSGADDADQNQASAGERY